MSCLLWRIRFFNNDEIMEDLKIDWTRFMQFFNDTMKRNGSCISPLRYISKGKKAQVQRLVKEIGTKQVLVDAVVHLAKSDFLNGRVRSRQNSNGFLASFAWMLSSDEIIFDLANGKYDNPPEVQLSPEEQRQLEQEEYRRRQEQRREEARRIYEEEMERQREEREKMYAGAARGEELQAIFDKLNSTFDRFKSTESQEKN